MFLVCFNESTYFRTIFGRQFVYAVSEANYMDAEGERLWEVPVILN